MTDLTERLRNAARKLRGWAKMALATDPETVTGSTLLYEEAADEITALREALHAAGDGDTWRDAAKRVEGELERTLAECALWKNKCGEVAAELAVMRLKYEGGC